MTAVKPIPDGYPHVSASLSIDGADAAIKFYTDVLGATERLRMPTPEGKIAHAELQLGDSVVMLSDAMPDMDALSPKAVGGTPVTMFVYTEDVDAVLERAVKTGAKVLRPVENQFYGDRTATFEDPFGHRWSIATHVEDVSEEEMNKRMAEMSG